MGETNLNIEIGPSPQAARGLLEAADLPSSDLGDEQIKRFFYCGSADAPSALVGLEIYGDSALLRSLVVSSGARFLGHGSALVTRAEKHALASGVRTLYLLTTTAEPFFQRLGYERTERRLAPPAIQLTREFASLCPANSAFMVKRL
jgi:amino-acid N-acetyltransferase